MMKLSREETDSLVKKLLDGVKIIENPWALDKNYNLHYNSLDKNMYEHSRLLNYEPPYRTNFEIHADIYNEMPESVLGMTDKQGNIWMNYKTITKNNYSVDLVLTHEARHNTIGPAYKMFRPAGEEDIVRYQTGTQN